MEVLLPLPNNSLLLLPISITTGRGRAAPKPKRRRHCCRSSVEEIRVCNNRTCRRQGSLQTLETLAGVAPPSVTVKACGCLGRCGSGPNLVALPGGVVFGHCATAARSAEVMVVLCGADPDDAKKSLEALALRKKAEIELEKGSFLNAESLLSQAIELKPIGGINIIYKDRSRTRLAMSKYAEALEDAREALTFRTQYVEGHICQGDAFLAMNQFDLAEKSYLTALDIDPSIRRSKSFKVLLNSLRSK
ncbi:Small glutamine-rich tetratricopeptide repeat-containing protein beta [Morus notabilis]|uniref:Small glutamine-rich tetratricopeptide repeat-containing protein beta n=1 Tax=Morus notabilis TaxID=981085 RepID=W9RZH2_9ROSA|nr:Small glutamine-rich tetratricopeptide repeat-containing protein beta [Morus notabilis]